MASKFYLGIIEEEKERFKLKNKSLTAAAQAVSAYHWKKSIGKRSFLLDYNKPPNRCAYLYKYGTINSGLVAKYFRKLSKKKAVKDALHSKKSIKVCCFGGGPGTDVFGVFRALAVNPSFHGKISEVSVLDKCGGWDNMFNNIMSGLLDGKVEDIPATFINQDNFYHTLIEVDLLNPLPQNIMEIISSSDIVCMTRFFSDILGDGRSSHALKVLGNLIKLGALVLYVDIFNEKVFELSEDICKDNGLTTVIGPLHEKFFRPVVTQKDVFGSGPQFGAKFSIIGWCKTSSTSDVYNIFDDSYSTTNNSDTESEDLSASIFMSDSEENYECLNEPISQCHEYTQTESNILTHTVSSENEDFEALVKAISDLLNVIERRKKRHALGSCCCHH